MDLNEIRLELDSIDSQIITLLNRRRQISGEVAAFKAPLGMEIYQPAREAQILERVQALSEVEPHGDMAELYTLVLKQSRAIQQAVIDASNR